MAAATITSPLVVHFFPSLLTLWKYMEGVVQVLTALSSDINFWLITQPQLTRG